MERLVRTLAPRGFSFREPEDGSLPDLEAKIRGLCEGFSIPDVRNIHKAMRYAEELHRGQKRADGTPYILHVFRVVQNLIVKLGVKDVDLVCAAFCHDLIEDQSMRVAEVAEEYGDLPSYEAAIVIIKEEFGPRVERVVGGMTHLDPRNGGTPEDKRVRYFEKVKNAIKDPDVFFVKLADFYDNAFTLENITDPHRRLHRAKKYRPVFGAFIERLQQSDIALSPEKKREIADDLARGATRVEEIITATEDPNETRA